MAVGETLATASRYARSAESRHHQGEVLGLQLEDLNLDKGEIRVRRSRLRPRYAHGCVSPCGRTAGYCPDRHQTNAEKDGTKSCAGRRRVCPYS